MRRLVRGKIRQIAAAERGENKSFGLRRGDAAIDVIVDRYRRRSIALSKAGTFADENVARAHALESLLQAGFERVCAAQMTGHIRAHAQIYFGRRFEMKMRIEVGHTVQAIQRNFRSLGQRLQLFARKIPVLILDRSKIVEYQTSSGRIIARRYREVTL